MARRGTAIAAAVLLVLIAGTWWRATSSHPPAASPASRSGSRPSPGRPGDARDAAQITQTLTALARAWRGRDREAFVAAAGRRPGAAEWAAQVYQALSALHVRRVALRYAGHPTSVAGAAPGPADEFLGDVEVRWVPGTRPRPGYQTAPVSVRLRLAEDAGSVSVLGVAGLRAGTSTDGQPLPVWLAGDLTVDRSGSVRCIGVDTRPRSAHCAGLARTAVTDLGALLPFRLRERGGSLSIVVPADEPLSAALLGSSASALDQIAAVTTTVDASDSAGAPAIVVLNPAVFDRLDPAGAQVVVSHEATHAVTGAAAAAMEPWVAEGFADYVALHDGRVPVSRAAAQLLSHLRDHSLPNHLPSGADFGAARHGLGRTYEAAWLIFRYLAGTYGNTAVVDFYRRVLDGDSVAGSLRADFDLPVAGLTTRWRAYLQSLVAAGA